MFYVALGVLLLMSGAASRAAGGSRRATAVLLASSVAWPFVNRPIEGPILAVIGSHGIAATDVLAALGVILAIWVLSGRPLTPGGRPSGTTQQV